MNQRGTIATCSVSTNDAHAHLSAMRRATMTCPATAANHGFTALFCTDPRVWSQMSGQSFGCATKTYSCPRKSNAADPNRLARAERCWFVLLLKSNSVCYAPNTIDFHAHDIRILEEFIAEKAHARRCPSHDDRALPQRSTSGKVSNYLSD